MPGFFKIYQPETADVENLSKKDSAFHKKAAWLMIRTPQTGSWRGHGIQVEVLDYEQIPKARIKLLIKCRKNTNFLWAFKENFQILQARKDRLAKLNSKMANYPSYIWNTQNVQAIVQILFSTQETITEKPRSRVARLG